jgi:hypothetical protein
MFFTQVCICSLLLSVQRSVCSTLCSSYAVQAAVMCMCLGFAMAGFAVEKWSGGPAIIDSTVRSLVKIRFGQSDPLCEPLCEVPC